MQFTQNEEKLIKSLRKQDRNWRYIRWILLAIGAFAVVDLILVYGWMFFPILNRLATPEHPDVEDALVIAFFYPKCLVCIGIAVFSFFVSWRDWNGNANRMLLLKLLDAQQKRDASDTK